MHWHGESSLPEQPLQLRISPLCVIHVLPQGVHPCAESDLRLPSVPSDGLALACKPDACGLGEPYACGSTDSSHKAWTEGCGIEGWDRIITVVSQPVTPNRKSPGAQAVLLFQLFQVLLLGFQGVPHEERLRKHRKCPSLITTKQIHDSATFHTPASNSDKRVHTLRKLLTELLPEHRSDRVSICRCRPAVDLPQHTLFQPQRPMLQLPAEALWMSFAWHYASLVLCVVEALVAHAVNNSLPFS
mmetsp:Transcript_133983/g.299471  ORF Transcript_133983/g.299471 Transcript_133983/m.299471 type:complete len:244 (-) Transcript_133983:51-782(-)